MSELAWTPAELAEQFQCEVRLIHRLIHEGAIPHVKISPQRVIIPKRPLEQWLADEATASTLLAEIRAAS